MPIYERPVRELLREFVADRGIVKGQVFPKSDIAAWFRAKYPRVKPNTVQAQTISAITNSRTRAYYNADARYDIFYQTDRGMLRLYDPESDPAPIYTLDGAASKRGLNTSSALGEGGDDESSDEVASDPGEFAYESDLKNYLADNLSRLEPGLRLYNRVEGVSGLEFPVGGRYVDILAFDAEGNIVVIELKVSRGYDRVVGQILRYMAWIEQHEARNGEGVRGIIVARNISDDLILACSKIQNVSLYEYTLSVTLARVEIASNAGQSIPAIATDNSAV